jgi:hypothetical protein
MSKAQKITAELYDARTAAADKAAADRMAELEARLKKAEDENARLKASKTNGTLRYKVSEKGAVSVYGLTSKWPTTLYGNQWRRLLAASADLIAFLDQAEAQGLLSVKDNG